MVLLISLLLVSPLIWWGGRSLREHESLSYAVCILLSFLTVPLCLSSSDSSGYWESLLAGLFTKGGIAGCLFLFVMFAGAMPDGSLFRKRVLPLRRQLSIMASFLTLGHAASYGSRYLLRLFTSPSELRLSTLLASVVSFLLLVLLIPLFVTSLRAVRKRMRPKSWKRLQRSAYLFYALLYLHILFFRMQAVREGDHGAVLSVCLYSLVFFGYLTLRLYRLAAGKNRPGLLLPILLGSNALMLSLLFLCLGPAVSGNTPVQSKSDQDIVPKVWADGTYKGAAIGYNGRLKVTVVIEDGKIADLALKSHVEDEPYVTRATKGIFSAMVKRNTPDVDAVSSATTTSEALIEAVHQAIDPAELP